MVKPLKSAPIHDEKRSFKRQALQITALIMAPVLGAQAQDAAGESQKAKAEPLPEVVVKGQQEKNDYKPERVSSPKQTEPLLDLPQSVTVVPKGLIEEQGATSLRDVLRNVPGISMQAGEGGVPAGDNLSIRGFNSRTDLFLDGIRDFGGYSRDPFNVEQVEVVKGPASTFSGRGSTGGSVNLVSKSPTLDAFYAGSLGVGTHETYRMTLDLNQPIPKGIEGTSLRFNAVWHDAEVSGRDTVENSRFGLAPSLVFGLGTPTRVTLSYFHLEENNRPDYGIPWVPATNTALPRHTDEAPPVDFENYYGLKQRDFEHTQTAAPTLKVEHEFNETISLRNISRYSQTRRDSVITAPRFASNASTDINRQIQSRDQKDALWINQTDVTLKWEGDQWDNTLVPGVEVAHETSVNYPRTGAAAVLADLFDPNAEDPYPGQVTRTGVKNEANATSYALYVFDTVKLNEKYELTGGIRWDSFDLDYETSTPGAPDVELSRKDEMLSWRTGFVYKPVPNGSLYVAYGTSFNPAAEGLTLSTSATAAANVNVDPEESRTLELGTKWDFFDARLNLTAAIFRTDKTNARTQDPADATDTIVLEGEQRVEGIELGLGGSITRAWKIYGGYTFLHSEVRKSNDPNEIGNELTNTPEHSFSLWSTYDFPFKLQLGLGGQFVDSRYANTINTRQAPSYFTMDGTIAYQINKQLSLRLNAYNLLDEKYIDRIGGGHFVPGVGRSAMLTASYRF